MDPLTQLLAQTETLVQAAESTEFADKLSEGLVIAAAGIVIVFSALLLISLFIAMLPRVLTLVSRVWPEVQDGRHEAGYPESQVADDTDVLAAIGFVLHTEFQKQLSAESSAASKS